MKKGHFTLTVDQIRSARGSINKILLNGITRNGETEKLEIDYLHHNRSVAPEPESLDGYVCAVIFYLMENATDLKVDGALSNDFLRNIRLFSEAWQCWKPEQYAPISIEAKSYQTGKNESVLNAIKSRLGLAPAPQRALLTFSGGVDACFSLARHAHSSGILSKTDRYNIKDAVMVQGFDVDHRNDVGFESLQNRVHPILNSFHTNLLTVKTNIRAMVRQNWEHSFAAQVASVLHQFSQNFEYGIIGSSEPYTHMINSWGSHPATDYLLSSGFLSIIHDGAGFSRTSKVAQIGKFSSITSNLKVCWEGNEQDKNCGVCEKCVRTKLNFVASGQAIPGCFFSDLTPEQIMNIPIRNEAALAELRSIIQYAEKANTANNPLICSLKQKINGWNNVKEN